jgi:putative Holliday junction resolvase
MTSLTIQDYQNPKLMSEPPIPPPKEGSYLGFDYGDKHIGIAVGQRLTCTATGLVTIPTQSTQARWNSITKLVEAWQPCGFVVGLAYQEDGSENPITPQILKFCRQLEGRYRLPVYTMDETLSTVESKSLFYQSRAKRSTGFGAVKDILAAQLILQTWLEHVAHLEKHKPSGKT